MQSLRPHAENERAGHGLFQIEGELIMGLHNVELVMAFEEKFGINIPNEDAAELTTPRQVTAYVMSTAKGQEMNREEVAVLVRKVIEETTGVSDFNEDSHFVAHMHLWRSVVGGLLGLALGAIVLPIQAAFAPRDTSDILPRLFFIAFFSPFIAATAVVIGFVIILVNGILKRTPPILIRVVIGIMIGVIIGSIASYIDNADKVSRGILPAGMMWVKYGVLVGGMAGAFSLTVNRQEYVQRRRLS